MTATRSDVERLARCIQDIIRRRGTDHWKHTRVGLKKLRLSANASGLYLHGEKLTYCCSVLFYGAICNRYRQHDIHIFLCRGKLYWGRSIPNIATIAENPDARPEETSEEALLTRVDKEIAAVKAAHDRIMKEAYAWRLCENVIQGIARLENWSVGEGKVGTAYAGDIQVTGEEVRVLLRSDAKSAERVRHFLKTYDGQLKHISIRKNKDTARCPGDECELVIILAKESPAVEAVKHLAELCRPGRTCDPATDPRPCQADLRR